jgi:hypothetical protein
MSLITHVFNVGDANFTVTHDNGVMIIGDAGIGQNAPENVFSGPSPGLKAFQNIIRSNGIHTIHTVISHQHTDHYDLLPDLFQVVKREQDSRRAARGQDPSIPDLQVGRFIIGGRNQGADSDMNQTLAAVNHIMYPPPEDSEQPSPMRLNVQFVLNTPFTDEYSKRIYFKDATEIDHDGNLVHKQKYLKILFPQDTRELDFSNPNETSLVSMLVAKRTPLRRKLRAWRPDTDPASGRPIKQVQKGLLWGDATTKLQQQLEAEQSAKYLANPAKHTQTLGPVDFAVLPHHLSRTGEQAMYAANVSSELLPYSQVAMIGSTGRPASAINPALHGIYTTRNLSGTEAFTNVMRVKHYEAPTVVQSIDELFAKAPKIVMRQVSPALARERRWGRYDERDRYDRRGRPPGRE